MNILQTLKDNSLKIDRELATVTGFFKTKLKLTEKVINPKKINPQKKLINTKKPRICVVYLVSPRAHMHNIGFMNFKKETSKLEVFKESLKTAVEYLPPYPIFIYHEDYTKKDIKDIETIAKGRIINFIKVDFNHYKNHGNLDDWMKKQPGFVEGRPAGYRLMCRFFSGILQNHSALDNFDYYIRMDHDSFFIEPKTLDVEECIRKYDFDYLYRSVWTDHKEKEAIWEFTKKYAKKNKLSLKGFKKLGMLDSKGNFNGRSPYNNFHISKIAFWRRADVKKFLSEIEKVDGSVVRHWHDTNIQSMLLGLFNATVLEKTDFGYKHNFHHSIQGSLKIKYLEK
jgi:hypothetical protein